ncbi:uncharacterized protein [Amphiura filiformis]|uniref:uncharacterized protein isoform X2 n=1 Tax=Amphiura filiformis TaxID=82378 RepID=UPI003B213B51
MMRRPNARAEPIDMYLSTLGLYRKITAKDGSCLFRAVAEQVFYTQALHVQVREACVRFIEHNRERFEPFIEGPFDHHIYRLRNPKEWAGQVEISALSLMYKRDFVIYQEPEQAPTNVTQNGFEDKVMLCFSHGNHYDSVFRKRFQEAAAICQAVIYEILYKDVFKLPREADEAVEVLRSSTKKPRRDSFGSQDGNRENDPELEILDNVRAHRRPPLPYKVAKALDPEIYRNVEFDAWNEMKKEQQHKDYLIATGLQYAPGDKCQVVLEDSKRLYNAHIQEVQPEDGPVTVYIQDLGEKHTVPRKNLRPVAPVTPQRPWSPVIGRGYRNLSGYYQKYTNGMVPDADGFRGARRGSGRRGSPRLPMNNGMILPQGFIPPHTGPSYDAQQPCMHLPQPHNRYYGPKSSGARNPSPPPRFQNRVPECVDQVQVGSRGQNMNNNRQGYAPHDRRGRGGGRYPSHQHRHQGQFDNGMSYEELEEKRVLEEVALFELQERDSASFPALPHGHDNNMSGTNPAHFWSKLRKGNRRTPSPHQRMNTPSPINQTDQSTNADDEDESLNNQFEDVSINDPESTNADDEDESLNNQFEDVSINEPNDPDYLGAEGGDMNAPMMNRPKTPGEEYMGQVVNHMGSGGSEFLPTQEMPQQPIPVASWVNTNGSPASSSTTGSIGQYQSNSSTPSPPTIAVSVGYNTGQPATACPLGVPFYPMVIPVMEYLSGPINLATQPSKDPGGNDLPYGDISTMRYFFNLGVEYNRRICMVQQAHWQQQQQQMQLQQTDSGYASAGPYNPSPPPPPLVQQQQVQPQQQHQQQQMQQVQDSEGSPIMQLAENTSYNREPSGPNQCDTSVSDDERESEQAQPMTSGASLKSSGVPQLTSPTPEEPVHNVTINQASSKPCTSSSHATPITVTVSLASASEPARVLSSSNIAMIPQSNQMTYQQLPQTPVHSIPQAPQTPIHSIPVPMGTDIDRRDNRIANVTPLKSSIPRNIPSKLEAAASERGVIGSMHSTTPSPTILFCFPDGMDMNSQPRLSMETPPRRMSSLDMSNPAGVFPMSPFPSTNNIFTSPSNTTGAVHRQHQSSYYADSMAPSLGNMNQHLPPSHPQAYYGPVPTNHHNSNIQTESAFSHPMGQFQHQAPPPLPPAPISQPTNYQYPLQPSPAQWGPAGYQYGSPVKAPAGIPPQYGQSPPAATYVTNTAPIASPTQYMPANQ